MIKYADIKGYKDLGEVSPHLYQWLSKDDTKELRPTIIVRAYDTSPKIFKGIILSKSQEYYPLEITEDLSELESFVGELEVVTDLKDLSEDLKGFKLIESPKEE